MNNNAIIFSGRGNPELTKLICNYINKREERNIEGKIEISDFPGGEIYSQFLSNVRGRDVFLVQSTQDPNNNWMELYQLVHSAKLAAAEKITVVIPFFTYARQDRKDKPRTPITMRMVLDILSALGVNRIITLDIHNNTTQGFTNLPFDSLLPCNLIISHFNSKILKNKKNDVAKWIAISPDVGGIKKIEKYAECLGVNFGLVHKKRIDATTVEQKALVGDVKGKNVILIDDMSETLGTLTGAAKLVKEHGAKKVIAYVIHMPLTDRGKNNLKRDDYINKIITTNSVPIPPEIKNNKKVTVIDTSELFGEAILRTIHNRSISSLFDITGF